MQYAKDKLQLTKSTQKLEESQVMLEEVAGSQGPGCSGCNVG